MSRFFSLKGINWWLLASAIGLNFIWALVMLLGFAFMLDQGAVNQGLIQIGMLAACFILPFLAAWLVARMADDGMGPNYGIYGSLGAAVPLLVVLGSSGVVGMIFVITTLLGGLNGGILSLRRSGKGSRN